LLFATLRTDALADTVSSLTPKRGHRTRAHSSPNVYRHGATASGAGSGPASESEVTLHWEIFSVLAAGMYHQVAQRVLKHRQDIDGSRSEKESHE
jgi:hypothetical protein